MAIKFEVSGAKFEVSPDVRYGEDRGGEDLFLVVRGLSEADPPASWSREDVDAALRGAPNGDDDDDTFLEYEPGELVRHVAGEYSHVYESDWKGFVELVHGLLAGADWKFSRGSRTWSTEAEHFVDGNAD